MKVLHIASYYQGSKVYKNLFSRLDVKSNVFVAVRTKDSDFATSNVLTIRCLNIFTRLFYSLKIASLFFNFYNAFVDLKNEGLSLIHAHTLYADGVLAYFFSLIAKSELVITIRTTDVDYGFKYYRHYRWLVRKALKRSKKIIFISPTHRVKFIDYFGDEFNHKFVVIPNGVDNFYINSSIKKKTYSSNLTVGLCIASFNKNKNLKNTISAFHRAAADKQNAKLYIVGGTYKEYAAVYGPLRSDLQSRVFFLGVLNKAEILEKMQEATFFIMVSHSETFGLVYIEAISQCLPIIYTCHQGVDGYFDDGQYGFNADSTDVESISIAIKNTLNKFPNGLGPFEHNPAIDFSWDKIAKVYKEVVYK
ncbi:glycosyltransferase family 4 protein [Pseudoalteromonas rhizosphaerae]|uniref:glycosyltransferase family 4 protein n=1 Tax=Pseudoalteromonas rhizosphaerae TaxID=2518973 RepID=UPI003851393D